MSRCLVGAELFCEGYDRWYDLVGGARPVKGVQRVSTVLQYLVGDG
jgi:hypothetical protein